MIAQRVGSLLAISEMIPELHRLPKTLPACPIECLLSPLWAQSPHTRRSSPTEFL